MAESNLVLILGVQDVSQEWISVARAGFVRNFDAAGQLLACRSLRGAMSVQSGLVREHLEHGVSAVIQIGHVCMRVADEATRVITLVEERVGGDDGDRGRWLALSGQDVEDHRSRSGRGTASGSGSGV